MEKLIVVLLALLVFLGLFFYCHGVLKFQGTASATAMSIRYRYWQMWLPFFGVIGTSLIWDPDFFWVGTSAGLSASALYYAARFGVLLFFSFIALVGVFSWSLALGSSLVAPAQMALIGMVLSFIVDLIWNRELKKRNLPPPDVPEM